MRNFGEDQKHFIAEEGSKLFFQGNSYHVSKHPKFYILDVRKLKLFAGEKMLYLRWNKWRKLGEQLENLCSLHGSPISTRIPQK